MTRSWPLILALVVAGCAVEPQRQVVVPFVGHVDDEGNVAIEVVDDDAEVEAALTVVDEDKDRRVGKAARNDAIEIVVEKLAPWPAPRVVTDGCGPGTTSFDLTVTVRSFHRKDLGNVHLEVTTLRDDRDANVSHALCTGEPARPNLVVGGVPLRADLGLVRYGQLEHDPDNDPNTAPSSTLAPPLGSDTTAQAVPWRFRNGNRAFSFAGRVVADVCDPECPPLAPVGGGGGGGGGSGTDGCGVVVSGNQSKLLTEVVAGRTREFTVRRPNNYDRNKRYPVIFTFHGDTSPNNSTTEEFGLSAANLLGAEAIFVIVQGENRGPNSGFSWDTTRLPPNNEDIALFDAMVTRVRAELCVDTDDPYAVGFSGGGFFVNTLSCYRGGVRATAVMEGGYEDGFFDSRVVVDKSTCVSDRTPAQLIIHQTNDPVVDVVRYGDGQRDFLRPRQHCDAAALATPPFQSSCSEFTGCDDGLVYCRPVGPSPAHTADTVAKNPAIPGFFRRFF